MTKPTIIFDLDGTLADTSRDLVAVLNRTVASHGVAPLSTKQVGYYAGLGGSAMIEMAFQSAKIPLPDALLHELSDIYLEDYSANLSVETVLFPGALQILEHFSKRGWLITICSNKHEILIGKFLNDFDIRHLFDAFSGADTFEHRKPHPQHLVQTVLHAGGNPNNALMVGDARPDFLAAKSANIPVVAVDFGYSEHPVGTFNPEKIISHFDELPSAVDQIIESNKFGISEGSKT